MKIKNILNHHLAFWDTKPFPPSSWWFFPFIWASLTGCGSGPLPHLCLALMRFTIKSLGFITMMVKIPITSYITPWKFNIAPEKWWLEWFVGWYIFNGFFCDLGSLTQAPENIWKIYHPKKYSNHHFSGGELFNFRGVRLPKRETTKGRRGLLTWETPTFCFQGTLGNLQES